MFATVVLMDRCLFIRYMCMQKPFKRHPEMDFMIKDVLDADPEARIILHEDESPYNRKLVSERPVKTLRP